MRMSLKGVSSAADGLLAYYNKVRAQHPTKIMLVRVGDFYEVHLADILKSQRSTRCAIYSHYRKHISESD